MNPEDILAKLRERVSEPDAKTDRSAINVREQFEALYSMLSTYGMAFDTGRVLEAATALVAARIIADAIHGVANEIVEIRERS